MIKISERLEIYNALLKFAVERHKYYSTLDKKKAELYKGYIVILNNKIESLLEEICKD